MTHNQKLLTVRAMKQYGGSFVKALAECCLLADDRNFVMLEEAFPEYMAKYGPGSDMYEAMSKLEA